MALDSKAEKKSTAATRMKFEHDCELETPTPSQSTSIPASDYLCSLVIACFLQIRVTGLNTALYVLSDCDRFVLCCNTSYRVLCVGQRGNGKAVILV